MLMAVISPFFINEKMKVSKKLIIFLFVQIFDLSLQKKKKKKKTGFDLDAAQATETVDSSAVESTSVPDDFSRGAGDDAGDMDENLDLESFGKKKRKKKKPFNLEELDVALPTTTESQEENIFMEGVTEETGNADEEIEIDMDFSKTKKKKKKKKELEELVADKLEDDATDDKENSKFNLFKFYFI